MSKYDEIKSASKQLYKYTARLNIYIQNSREQDPDIIKELLLKITALYEIIYKRLY